MALLHRAAAQFEQQAGSPRSGTSEDPVETAHQNLTAIDCGFIVCCVDRPKLLEHRGCKYCQVPFGDAPSAQAELREKMAATYSFIDNARWVHR